MLHPRRRFQQTVRVSLSSPNRSSHVVFCSSLLNLNLLPPIDNNLVHAPICRDLACDAYSQAFETHFLGSQILTPLQGERIVRHSEYFEERLIFHEQHRPFRDQE
jgi:hypothetical protein